MAEIHFNLMHALSNAIVVFFARNCGNTITESLERRSTYKRSLQTIEALPLFKPTHADLTNTICS